jgi:hypothetical protein
MIELQPKKRFLDNEDATRYFRSVADHPLFHQALALSLAELSLRQSTTGEHLAGARAFIHILQNLAEIEPERPQLPARRIMLHPDTRKKPETPTNPQSTE